MEQSYFKEYYQLERENWWFLIRKKILQNRIEFLLNTPRNKEILNVGAATGSTTEMLYNFGKVVSIEYDKECCDFANTYMTPHFINGDIENLSISDNSFDLVCAFDVIEHVKNDQKAIDELLRVCKPGGTVAVTVPAYQFLWGPHDIINHHFKRYTLGELKKLFEQKKGTVTYVTYFNSILFVPIAIFRILISLLSFLKLKQNTTASSDHSILGINGIFNSILGALFNVDYTLLKTGLKFPFGVSIMIFYKKDFK